MFTHKATRRLGRAHQGSNGGWLHYHRVVARKHGVGRWAAHRRTRRQRRAPCFSPAAHAHAKKPPKCAIPSPIGKTWNPASPKPCVPEWPSSRRLALPAWICTSHPSAPRWRSSRATGPSPVARPESAPTQVAAASGSYSKRSGTPTRQRRKMPSMPPAAK